MINPTIEQRFDFIREVKKKTGETKDQILERYPEIKAFKDISIDRWQNICDMEGV